MKRIDYTDDIFVAGAKGMVGNAICKELIKQNYGNEELGGKLLAPSREDLDLSDSFATLKWFEKNKPSIVILSAAKVGGIHVNNIEPASFLLNNLKIQNNVIEASFRFGVKRLLFLGSSCIYPKFANQPINEDELLTGSLEETNKWYAIAKIAGLKLCEALRIQYNFDAITLMPTNLYGPGDNYHYMNSHVLPALIRKFYEAKVNSEINVKCWGTGNALREFLHVNDFARACLFVLEHNNPILKKKNSNILNVGSGQEISIRDLAIKIAKFVEFKGDIIWDQSKPDGTPRKLLNSEGIYSLGWFPKIDLDEGIQSTLELFIDSYKKGEFRGK